jgi:hypothetical protein
VTVPHGPFALPQHLRTVIETGSRSRNEKIRQVRPDPHHVAPCQVHHPLLRRRIRHPRRGQLAGRRFQKGRLIGKQLERQRGSGSERQVIREPVQRGFGETFRELQIAQPVSDVGIGPMRRGVGGQRLFQLRDLHAL